MTARDDAFTRRLVTRFGRLAIRKARPGIPSRALRRALNLFVVNDRVARMQIPHFWALYVHDGRGPFGPRRAKFLVWFRNPKRDPRLAPSGVTPVRARNIKRLSREEFVRGLQENAEARDRGLPPPMIITRRVKTPSQARKFFDNRVGMRGFVQEANQVGNPMVREFILASIFQRRRLTIGGASTLVRIEQERDTARIIIG